MSRDWTPREQLLSESILKDKTWRDITNEMMFVNQDGTTEPMYNEKTLNFINQFNYLSRIGFDAVLPIYKKYGEKCKQVLLYVEKCLTKYIENGIILEKWISDWFEGKLSKQFYYAEENNQLFFLEVEKLMNNIKN